MRALEEARRAFRAERKGVLVYDGLSCHLRFVVDPRTGHVVAPVEPGVFECFEAVLYLPEESEEALQLLLTPESVDGETHPAAYRWRIHHGDPEYAQWAKFHVESGRQGPMVFDGDAFMVASPLEGAEPGLCKLLNADREALREACHRELNVDIECPVCVGVDRDGLHVRARWGLVRLEFVREAFTEDEARAEIEALLKAR